MLIFFYSLLIYILYTYLLPIFFIVFLGSKWSLLTITNHGVSIENDNIICFPTKIGTILGFKKIQKILTQSGTSVAQFILTIEPFEPFFIQINHQFNNFFIYDLYIFLSSLSRFEVIMQWDLKNLCMIFWGKAPDHLLNYYDFFKKMHTTPRCKKIMIPPAVHCTPGKK